MSTTQINRPDARETFQQIYCRRYNCPPEQFAERFFWRCIFPHAIPLAWIIRMIKRDYFKPDFMIIRQLALCTALREVSALANALHYDYHYQWPFIRETLRVRISGKRLVEWGRRVFHAPDQNSGK
ncbi:MAG: hypothetical protein AB1813_11825 [Verrucomicrobiota bacterium]|jgi:hypothetical protein